MRRGNGNPLIFVEKTFFTTANLSRHSKNSLRSHEPCPAEAIANCSLLAVDLQISVTYNVIVSVDDIIVYTELWRQIILKNFGKFLYIGNFPLIATVDILQITLFLGVRKSRSGKIRALKASRHYGI